MMQMKAIDKSMFWELTYHMHPLNSLPNNTPAPVYTLYNLDYHTSSGRAYSMLARKDQRNSSYTAPQISPPLVIKMVKFTVSSTSYTSTKPAGSFFDNEMINRHYQEFCI